MSSTSVHLGPTRGQFEPDRRLRVEVVCVPWASFVRPSIQCSIVKAIATRAGHDAQVRYANLELADHIGPAAFSAIADNRHQHALVGEWLFSVAAFGEDTGSFEDYIAAHPKLNWAEYGFTLAEVSELRDETLPAWVAAVGADPAWGEVDVVAFSSTFEQNVAGIALAASIKRHHPDVLTLFGGSNFDGRMGPALVREFDAIDVVLQGEAEQSLPILLGEIARRGDPARAPGALVRRGPGVVTGPAPTRVDDLDDSPLPDYDDYFATVDRLSSTFAECNAGHRIPFETSRGCWWGQKHHCTFCGLNGETMSYRSKSPERAMEDIRTLSRRHERAVFESVDNILDLRYLPTLFRELAEGDLDLSLFYEIKANMKREQVRAMAMAGVDTIQPGIESLNTHVLTLMRKGTTALQNVRLLKWARYYGIHVNWNILMGFPGELEEDYRQQWELIPSLYHLQPPTVATRVWLERFSPLFTDPSFPVSNVTPQPAYDLIYPPSIDTNEIAYFFEYDAGDILDLSNYRKLVAETDAWIDRWKMAPAPSLVARRGEGWVEIDDTRFNVAVNLRLSGLRAGVTRHCSDRERSAEEITKAVRADGLSTTIGEVEEVLAGLTERRLVAAADGKYLFLPLPWRVR